MRLRPEMVSEHDLWMQHLLAPVGADQGMYGGMVVAAAHRWAQIMDGELTECPTEHLADRIAFIAMPSLIAAEESFAQVSPEGSLTDAQRALAVLYVTTFWEHGEHLRPLLPTLTVAPARWEMLLTADPKEGPLT